MSARSYKITDDLSGFRLDKALSLLSSSLSRAAIQEFIKSGRVTLNDKPITNQSIEVKTGDNISLELPPAITVNSNVLPIIYQDNYVVVFNKPSGVLVHPTNNLGSEWTVSDVMKNFNHEDKSNRVGIVHRLDRETSGVLIAAKNNAAKKYLQNQFAKRTVEKVYIALVEGNIEQDELSIDLPLSRDYKIPAIFTVNQSGKPAQTNLRVRSRYNTACLVELRPKTGRTHQLRSHMRAIGHPIIGDNLYGSVKAKRLMLHAQELTIYIRNSEKKTFTADLLLEFKELINDYRNR